MNRPEIVVDLDGVVYDWVTTMSQWLEYNGIPAPVEDHQTWRVWEDWMIPEGMFMRYWRIGIEQDVVYRQGPVMEGAAQALWYLSDNEFHITFATDRLSKFGLNKQVVDNTTAWLYDAGLPYRSLMFTANKDVRGAMFGIDDKPANVVAMQEADIAGFLYDAVHNQDADLPRVKTWMEFIEQIEGAYNG